MRYSIVLTTVLCSMFVSGAALAAGAEKAPVQAHQRLSTTDAYDTGLITAIDTAAHSITLADGNTYVLPGYLKVKTLSKGERVSIAYDMTPDGRIADVRSLAVL
jgi:Protein of unknown function (DUF1344)